MKPRVLVAGGTGTIGIPLVHQLIERGMQVQVVSLDDPSYASSVLPKEVQFRRMDLTDPAYCLDAVEGMDWVFNLVGIKGSVGLGQTKVASYLVPMLRFQTNLMQAAFEKHIKRYLFVGSVNEYPPSLKAKEEDTVWDGAPRQNDRIPGLAKRIGEVQAEAYLLEHKWEAPRIVRPSNVYGPFDDFNSASAQVIPSLIRRVSDGENHLKVWGDGSAVRDFIYSEDAAYWMIEAMEKAPPCVPINLSSGEAVSIKQLAEIIAALADVPPTLVWDPTGPAGDPVRLLSIDRAKKYLNYQTRTSLREGLRLTYEWFRQSRELASKRGKYEFTGTSK